MLFLTILWQAAVYSGNLILRKKSLDEMKELADKTGLEMMKGQVEDFKIIE